MVGPRIVIVIPVSRNEGDLEYEDEVSEVEAVLESMFSTVVPLLVEYLPRPRVARQAHTTAGKILVQYDPMQNVQ